MNIPIGKKIKELRAEKRATQEQLATFLGVTPQAVSRWESQYAYPDIELLPAIADYFAVTTDELLGVRKDERELRLAEVKKEIARLRESGETKAILAFARQAAAEFPAEEAIQLHLAESLQRLMFDETEKPDEAQLAEAQNEAERIFLTLLEATRDMDVPRQRMRPTGSGAINARLRWQTGCRRWRTAASLRGRGASRAARDCICKKPSSWARRTSR